MLICILAERFFTVEEGTLLTLNTTEAKQIWFHSPQEPQLLGGNTSGELRLAEMCWAFVSHFINISPFSLCHTQFYPWRYFQNPGLSWLEKWKVQSLRWSLRSSTEELSSSSVSDMAVVQRPPIHFAGDVYTSLSFSGAPFSPSLWVLQQPWAHLLPRRPSSLHNIYQGLGERQKPPHQPFEEQGWK